MLDDAGEHVDVALGRDAARNPGMNAKPDVEGRINPVPVDARIKSECGEFFFLVVPRDAGCYPIDFKTGMWLNPLHLYDLSGVIHAIVSPLTKSVWYYCAP